MLTDLIPKLDGLKAILSRQIEAHKELTSHALNLKDALVSCDHEAIERIGFENERAAAKVRQLENERSVFLRDTGFPDEDLPLSAIMEKALADVDLTEEEMDILDDLSNLRAELAGLVNNLDHHNQLNMTLVGQALEYHNFSMRLLLNAASGEATGYTREGTSRPDDGSGIFDGLA